MEIRALLREAVRARCHHARYTIAEPVADILQARLAALILHAVVKKSRDSFVPVAIVLKNEGRDHKEVRDKRHARPLPQLTGVCVSFIDEGTAEGRLRAVVCTSSLDLGIDWGDVDLVVNVGAPKGASRLLQRIGRANHRMDEPSKGVLIPANRFEVVECSAALQAIAHDVQDAPAARIGGLDVLAQHILGSACGEPIRSTWLQVNARSSSVRAPVSSDSRT